ncbi:MAG: DUF1801 domain-containing protein [Gammaproteobacteria bacterium]|nr:DUF1801 domain-containing protein [Gammaproteobacteria bacterium]
MGIETLNEIQHDNLDPNHDVIDIPNPKVLEKFQCYPKEAREKLLILRALILDVAEDLPGGYKLEETLKWNEPSYLRKDGSTIRINWRAKSPNHYFLYFNCNTTLVQTFREYYGDQLCFEGKRAIIVTDNGDTFIDAVREELKHCIGLALSYHRIKHLPMLGI